MLYSSAIDLLPTRTHLRVSGELDLWSGARLRREVAPALDAGARTVTVDAGGVTFVDAGGLSAFIGLRNAVGAGGGALTFVAASATLLWVCSVAGLVTPLGLDGLVPEPV